MNKFPLVLLVALALLVSSDALLSDSQTELSKVGPATMSHAVYADKRSLRGLESTEDGADEERGITELSAKVKQWAQSVKAWVTNSKLVQMAAKNMPTLGQKRRVAKASSLIEKGSSDAVLYANKVTPDEYFLAKGLDSRLKFVADSPTAWANNKGLEQWFTYAKYYAQQRRVAQASKLIKKGSSNAVLYANKVTPDEYLLAKGLDPKLKYVGDNPVVWAKNKGLKEWYMYAKYFEVMQKQTRA
ncbi:putative secreted RxLR effector protein [Phytophthora cinnamomi]|uniref:putative secreted RxLR effector protein n=1 Tax=Phytophthora cinnamomi TaxID=4785 RepID=UPI003559572C|nr:putative secreted RxLR effector protein [Phytophthora cinnamomi]